ncbi:MAG: DUF962 domain-containing protein [Burkholderiales bacterium]|nr:DUF962 domain-containing protein [Burkholderiales bacterium]
MSDTKHTRKLLVLLGKYEESHRHPHNEIIHFVCVPVIVWTVLALLWLLHPFVAIGAACLALVYYWTLSKPFALGMAIMAGCMLGLTFALPTTLLFPVALSAFVIAWIGQFIGHKIEGKKPSFFEDLQYLLIGPLFVLSFLYRRLSIRY